MASIEIKDVKKIANLARLKITEQEQQVYGESLGKILTWVEQMDAAPTEDLKPMAHPLDVSQRLREDKVTIGNLRDELQEVAPKVEVGLYLVPKVIE